MSGTEDITALVLLRRLAEAVGRLPERPSGMVQGHDLNSAYADAVTYLEAQAPRASSPTCTECGNPMREQRHENGRGADCC